MDLLLALLPVLLVLEANHVSALSVRLFRLFMECHLLFFLQQLSVCFHFFCPSITNFLISSCLETNFDCMSQVSLCIWPQVTNLLVSFLLSFWAWKGTVGMGLLDLLLSVGPGNNHVSFGGGRALFSTQFTENLGMANWPPAFGPQVSGLASEFWKIFERECLRKERHGCSSLFWALPLSVTSHPCSVGCLFTTCSDGSWVWDPWR